MEDEVAPRVNCRCSHVTGVDGCGRARYDKYWVLLLFLAIGLVYTLMISH